MIDRATRNHVVEGIRRFFTGQIPAADFIDTYLRQGVRSKDLGLRKVCREGASGFVDWENTFYKEGMTPEATRTIAFLESDAVE